MKSNKKLKIEMFAIRPNNKSATNRKIIFNLCCLYFKIVYLLSVLQNSCKNLDRNNDKSNII